jgi:hypothetical protein
VDEAVGVRGGVGGVAAATNASEVETINGGNVFPYRLQSDSRIPLSPSVVAADKEVREEEEEAGEELCAAVLEVDMEDVSLPILTPPFDYERDKTPSPSKTELEPDFISASHSTPTQAETFIQKGKDERRETGNSEDGQQGNRQRAERAQQEPLQGNGASIMSAHWSS